MSNFNQTIECGYISYLEVAICQNYIMFPLVLYHHPSVYCFICGRRGVAVARYRINYLLIVTANLINTMHVTCISGIGLSFSDPWLNEVL